MGLTRVRVGVGWVFTKMGQGRVGAASLLRRRRLVSRLQGLQLEHFFGRHSRRLAAALDPYLTVAEYDGGRMRQSDAYKEGRRTCSAPRGRPAAGCATLRPSPTGTPTASCSA